MKPNTFTRLYVHYIFTPRGRESLMTDSIREKIHKYIYGIVLEKKCFPVAINGTNDHIHILVGLSPMISVSELMRDIKRSSSLFINNQLNAYLKFGWQEGYGAFTVGYRELDHVYKYILNQSEHHSHRTFKEEYVTLLTDEAIDFNPEYLFEFYD